MNNKNIKIFNSYLAGIYEGQGHIWIPKIKLKKRFNNKQNPLFYITFKLIDKPLAQKILEILGSGIIKIKPKNNKCILEISSVKGLITVINSLNGELRTFKILELKKLILWINKNHNYNILVPNKKSSTVMNFLFILIYHLIYLLVK